MWAGGVDFDLVGKLEKSILSGELKTSPDSGLMASALKRSSGSIPGHESFGTIIK